MPREVSVLHEPGAIDLSRAPLPLLVGHDRSGLPVGKIDGLVVTDGKLRGKITFGASTQAQEIKQDVEGGIIRSLSIGYSVLEEQDNQDGSVTVTKWQPFECSLVAVPADNSVGIGRSISFDADKIRQMAEDTLDGFYDDDYADTEVKKLTAQAIRQQWKMDRFERKLLEVKVDCTNKNRVRDILAIGERQKMADLARQFVDNGKSVDEFRAAVLDTMEQRGQIAPVQTTDNIERNYTMNSYMGHGPAIHTTDHNYSLSRLLGALTSRRPADAGYELEISQELQRSTHRRTTGVLIPWGALQTRALTTSSASSVVPTIHGELVEPLRNASRVVELGATVLSGLQGNVSLPRQTGASTAQWVAESGTVTASDATFDSVTLTPKTVGALSRISRRLLLQSVPGIEEIIRKDLMAVIGLSIDQAALTGTGLSNQPTGIITDSGVSVIAIGTNGGAPAWATVVGMVGAAAAENALAGNLGFLTNGNVQAKLMGTFTNSTYGEVPLWGANPDGTGTVAGYKALTSNQVPANLTKGTGTNLSALFFGNWADLVIGQWGALEVAIDESTYFSSGDIQLRVLADVDIAIRHPESFVVCKDIVTT